MDFPVDKDCFYDILLLGRTGQGKSTTAKLLSDSAYGLVSGGESTRARDELIEVGDGPFPGTTECKLITNEKLKIRVLDTPSLLITRDRDVHEVFQSILDAQNKSSLSFHRVLYFLPSRGHMERVDSTFQEELKLIYDHLGEDVFNIMVIIVTNQKEKKYQQLEFSEENREITEKCFMTAFETIIGERCTLPQCPPILYLPFLEKDVITCVKGAKVICNQSMNCKSFSFTNNCSECTTQQEMQRGRIWKWISDCVYSVRDYVSQCLPGR